MEAGLDNANATNNPFANSNGTEILQQKEGFLLNLTENFKQNGAELSPANDYVFDRPANGKRPAEEFDEDEDMGPETDVDALDDPLMSPTSEQAVIDNKNLGCFDPFTTEIEDKSTLEMDLNIQKQQTSEFEPPRTPREETPTPPADEVHDAGVEENVADSGEDSEDEWNYYKGDSAESEQVSSSKADQEVAELTKTAEEDEEEAMSQLNPNAAEFVPISSPTRNVVSPACRALINDQVIAQSPRRATPSDIDINLPNPQDFEKEVKNRPSDVYSNGQDNENTPKLSSQEVMENLLNGKNIEDIEFHPSTPQKVPNPEEFHFGPNATPFSTPAKLSDQSEAALSTKAVFGDESSYLEGKTLGVDASFSTECTNVVNPSDDVSDFQPQLNKPTDPMSMSFYQDENETNPFDLNKVQMLPDDDDFLDKTENNGSFNETISDLPEHEPLSKGEPIVTDLDKPTECDDSNLLYGVSKLPETPEPPTLSAEDKEQKDEVPCDLPPAKSPILIEASKAPLPITPEPNSEEQDVSSAPKTPDAVSPLPSENVENVLVNVDDGSSSVSPAPPKSPYNPEEEIGACDIKPSVQSDLLGEFTSDLLEEQRITPSALSPEPTEELTELAKSFEPTDDELCQQTLETLGRPDSKSPAVITPEPTEEFLCQTRSPEEPVDTSKSPVPTPEPTTESCEDVVSNIIEKGEEVQEEFFPICQKTTEVKEEFFPICQKTTEVKEEFFPICQKTTEVKEEIKESSIVEEEFFPICSKPETIKSEKDLCQKEMILPEPMKDDDVQIQSTTDEFQLKSPLLTTDDIIENLSKSPVPTDHVEIQEKSPVPDITEIESKSPVPNIYEFQSQSPLPADTLVESLTKSPEPATDILAEIEAKPLEPTSDGLSKSPEPTTEILAENEAKSSELSTDINETQPSADSLIEILESTTMSPEPITLAVEDETKLQEQAVDMLIDTQAKSPEPGADILTESHSKSPEPILDDDLQQHSMSPEPNNDIPILCRALEAEKVTTAFKEQLNEEYSVSRTPEPAVETLPTSEVTDLLQKSPEPDITAGGDLEACKIPQDINPEPIQSLTDTLETAEQILSNEIQNLLDATEPIVPTESEAKSPETIEESLDSEKRDLESPMEDITSSIKDDNSLTPEIVEEAKDISTEKEMMKDVFIEAQLQATEINYTQEISNAMQENNDAVLERETVCQISSTPNTTISEQADTESVKTADVNSFLERSNMPDITSPLSPTEQSLERVIDAQLSESLSKSPLPAEDVIKTDLIIPQYPEEAVITTPSEDTKAETPTPTVEENEAPAALPEVALEAQEKEKTDEILVATAVGATAAAATVAAVTATAVKEKKTAGKPLTKVTPTTAKRTISKTGQSPTKTTASKPTTTVKAPTPAKPAVSSPTKPVPPKLTKTPSTPKAATKATTAKPSPKPKSEAPITKTTEKKPLMNGDVRAPIKASTTAKKPFSSTTTRSSITPKSPSTPKSSPTKPEVKSSATKVSATSTKTTTSGTTVKSTSTTKTTTTAPKPRPTSLPGKAIGSSTSTTKTMPAVSATKTTVQSKTSTTASLPKTTMAKPKPTSLAPKPRVSLTKTSATKGPDTEKQIKDSVNKQLTASRTTTTKTTGTSSMGKTTTTVKKTEIKTPSTRTTTTKTTITSLKPTKKLTEVTRIGAKKTTSTKTTTVKSEQNGLTNGVTTIVQETTTILSAEPQLIKDASPIENKLIVDNSQLSETNIAD